MKGLCMGNKMNGGRSYGRPARHAPHMAADLHPSSVPKQPNNSEVPGLFTCVTQSVSSDRPYHVEPNSLPAVHRFFWPKILNGIPVACRAVALVLGKACAHGQGLHTLLSHGLDGSLVLGKALHCAGCTHKHAHTHTKQLHTQAKVSSNAKCCKSHECCRHALARG